MAEQFGRLKAAGRSDGKVEIAKIGDGDLLIFEANSEHCHPFFPRSTQNNIRHIDRLSLTQTHHHHNNNNKQLSKKQYLPSIFYYLYNSIIFLFV